MRGQQRVHKQNLCSARQLPLQLISAAPVKQVVIAMVFLGTQRGGYSAWGFRVTCFDRV